MIDLFIDNKITEEEFIRKYDNKEDIFPKNDYHMAIELIRLEKKTIDYDFNDFEYGGYVRFRIIKNIKNRYFEICFNANYCPFAIICNRINVKEVYPHKETIIVYKEEE